MEIFPFWAGFSTRHVRLGLNTEYAFLFCIQQHAISVPSNAKKCNVHKDRTKEQAKWLSQNPGNFSDQTFFTVSSPPF